MKPVTLSYRSNMPLRNRPVALSVVCLDRITIISINAQPMNFLYPFLQQKKFNFGSSPKDQQTRRSYNLPHSFQRKNKLLFE